MIDQVIKDGKYKDTWESLQQYRVPDWYRDVKFGIFIHWGVYSVPAFGSEWYSRNMYIKGSREFEHHISIYGGHKDFGYKDFIPMFKAENFRADEWAKLFKEAGAQYVLPVAEHHDGFQMYDSELSIWNAKNMGPRRDVLGELFAELKKQGLICGASNHRAEHWFFMGHGKEFESDIKEPMERGDFYWPAMPEPEHFDKFSEPAPTAQFLDDWLLRLCELVDKYRPSIIYFDWWIIHSSIQPYLRKFAAYYYDRASEWGEEVVINYKHDAFQFGTAVPDVERGQFAEPKPYVWQSDTSVATNSWCYTENNDYKMPTRIICDLVDIVSKNGRLLLNIGPESDGTIPAEDKRILQEIGKWLRINGEAIYSSKVWRKSAEGPTRIKEGQFTDSADVSFSSEDFRFTVGNGCIYAICMNMQDCDSVCIKSLAVSGDARMPEFFGIIRSVEVLGYDKCPHWEQSSEGLKVNTIRIVDDKPVVFKIVI